MKLFPAFQKLSGRRVVIAGGGELAARKARLVWDTDVAVVFVAASFAETLTAEFAGKAQFVNRAPQSSDFHDAALIFIAEEAPETAEILAQMARSAAPNGGAPINVVDRPEISDFYTPSIIDRGAVTVAISTAGAAPVLGRRLREKIETLLPVRLGALAAFAQSFRTAVGSTLDAPARRLFWERVFDGPVAARFLAGDEAGAREAAIALLNRPSTAEKDGVVHIVGAGPGDPELLTLRALRLIQDADVILYDKLVGDGVMDMARRDADRIFVGKEKANHALPQEKIEALMITLAREGKNVVRLKGGDPFIFGRGGEEVDAMRAAGVPVTVTPGVTAATGCAASAGLPLTHRDHAQAVTFVTGHAKGDADPDLDWAALAALKNTLVVYMGVGKAGSIERNLLAHGRDGATPVAVIEKGTSADEKILKGRLSDLSGLIARGGVLGPALLVIGDTAALATEKFIDVNVTERLSA